jgi:hypothetical protein
MGREPVTVRARQLGLAIALAAAACAPGGSPPPSLSDYEIALRVGYALSVDPGVNSDGRHQIRPGGKLVLEMTAVRGGAVLSRDRGATWSVALELPANPDPGRPMVVTLDSAPAIARVAGEEVLYLARHAHGRITLNRTSEPVTGDLDIAFESPDRDRIHLGKYALRGAFKARVR